MRPVAAALAASGGPPPGGIPVAIVGAASPVHASGFGAAAGAGGYPLRTIPAPATLPLADLVARLNQARPLVLQGHTTKLALLAAEKRAGRLQIAPVAVTAMGELLTQTDRAAIGAAFGVPPVNQFTCTEGLTGQSDPGGTVLTFASDMCITELVDQDNQPVPDGTPSAKVLLTNLYNHTQPLIRYELTDRLTRHPASAGHWPPVRHRRGTRRRHLPLRGRSRSTRSSSAPSWSAPRPRWNTRSARPAAGSTSRSWPAARSTTRCWPPRSNAACARPACPTRRCRSGRSPTSSATPRPARPAGSSPLTPPTAGRHGGRDR